MRILGSILILTFAQHTSADFRLFLWRILKNIFCLWSCFGPVYQRDATGVKWKRCGRFASRIFCRQFVKFPPTANYKCIGYMTGQWVLPHSKNLSNKQYSCIHNVLALKNLYFRSRNILWCRVRFDDLFLKNNAAVLNWIQTWRTSSCMAAYLTKFWITAPKL